MEDEHRLTIIERFRLSMFKHTALARAGARFGLTIQTVRHTPDWNPELQAARAQHGRDAGLLILNEKRRRAWVIVDVSLDWYGDADARYLGRTRGQGEAP